jgi:FkbM family methyltransferase
MKHFSLLQRLHFLHRRYRYAYRTEPDTVRFLRELVIPGNRVLDIGANRGIITWFLARQVGSSGEVFSFEPQPELIPELLSLKSTYNLEQVNIINKGLADAPGTLPLYRSRACSTGTMSRNDSHTAESISVNVITLDKFLEERGHPPVHFIKCDVDGFEATVIRGSIRTISRDCPILLIEISENDVSAMATFLSNYGFHDFWFMFENRLYPGTETSRVRYRHTNARYRNFLFIHRRDPRRDRLRRIIAG